MEYGTLDTILNGVSAGLGISLLPRSSVTKAVLRGEITVMSLPDPYCRLEVGFVYARGEHISSALSALVQIITEPEL
ncbi:MAG: LysR substrate-binding domain-containing protein [Paenibacillus sp.]|uniref:LysR substrate-binding domain-containing protein n=1 Tax=Paenibacillus sp. TaxID=58172 RepID=UPI003B80194E